jgi:DNA-binding GntR family transcriptional regulator
LTTVNYGRKTARDLVADHLRVRILNGSFPPGRKLNVAEFSEEFGVSHTPTREALQLLASEGLVQLTAFRGASVAELSADEYEEIFLMRVNLEGLAARLGAERIDDDGIAAVRERFDALSAAAEADELDTFIEADRHFHRIHYLASGRQGLWNRIITLRTGAERYTRLGYSLPTVGMADTVKSHRRLLRAIEEHDGERAEDEMVTDLRRTFEAVHLKLVEDERETASRAADRVSR